MKIHPVARMFPDMGPEQFQELVDDIAQHGQREPVIVYKDRIVDGRHRWRACAKLGLPCWTEEWDQKGSLVHFVISRNLHRRHLDASQRAVIAAEILPMLEKEARHRMVVGGMKGGARGCVDKGSADLQSGGQQHGRRAIDEAGQAANVSARQVAYVKRIKEVAPELVASILGGELSVNRARKIIELSDQERLRVLELGREVGYDKALSESTMAAKRRRINHAPTVLDMRRAWRRLVKRVDELDGVMQHLRGMRKRLDETPAPRREMGNLARRMQRVSEAMESLIAS
jgi:hypothetical protein